jgi:hypothetical protein
MGLEGLLASDVIEFMDEAELLRDTEFKLTVLVTGLPAFSMLSIRDLTDWRLFWRLRLTLGRLLVRSSTWKLVGRMGRGSLATANKNPTLQVSKRARSHKQKRILLKHKTLQERDTGFTQQKHMIVTWGDCIALYFNKNVH